MASIFEQFKMHWARWLLAAAIVVHVLIMGSLFWGYLDSLFFNSHSGGPAGDFFSIYEAGQNAFENESVYEYEYPSAAQDTPYHAPFRYVPAFAYAFALPAVALPPWWAYWGWVAFIELLLIVNAYGTWRIAPRGTWRLVATAMWFVFTPFLVEQYMGQFSFLMATALFWFGVGIVRGRESVAGLSWVFSLVTKSSSALLAPLLLRLGWWRALAGGAVALAANATYFISRPEDIVLFYERNFGTFLNDSGDRFVRFDAGSHGLLSFLRNSYLALDDTATDLPAAFAVALMIGVIGYSLQATFFAQRTDPLLVYAIWVCAFFLFYQVWEFHYVMLLPVLVLLVAFRPAARPWALAAFVLLAIPTPYWVLNNVWNTGPVPGGFFVLSVQDVWPAWGVILYHAAKPLPVAVLWTYLAVSMFRQGVTLRWPSALRIPVQEDGVS